MPHCFAVGGNKENWKECFMIETVEKKLMRERTVFIVFCTVAVLLLVRAFYGFCQSDESFYISTAGRFAAGDLVFADEWHPTQLASIITMPFYKLYTLIAGGTYGIILFFRILYVLLTLLEACLVFRLISKACSPVPAFLVSLFLMLYCHLGIPTLSYYTMSFHFYILAFLTVYGAVCRYEDQNTDEGALRTAKWRREDLRDHITGGVFFSLSVLCLPTLAVAYLAVMAVLIICCIRIRHLRQPVLFFNLGIGICLAFFVIFLYCSGNSIAGLLANLPYIMSDAEHDRGYVESFKVFFRAVSDVFGRFYYLSILMVFPAMLTYVNKELIRRIRPYILLSDVVLFVYYVVIACTHTGFMNTALALFALPLFFLTEKKDWYIFLTLFAGGLIFSMTYSFSSFCDLYVLSIGHGIAAAGAIILIWEYVRENGDKALTERCFSAAACSFMVLFVVVSAVLRFSYVYRDDRLSRLDTRITAGPAAGLITSAEHEKIYSSLLSAIEKYSEGSGDTENNIRGILFSKILPWGYTASGLRAAAPDTWRNEISSERLTEYYTGHEMPDLVFVLNAYAASYESSGDVEADPAPNENDLSGGFADMLASEYEKTEEKDCTVYIRK